MKSLKNLLRFLQGLKACERLFRHSKFQLKFPEYTRGSAEEAALMKKISKIISSKTECLKSISLEPSSVIQAKLDLKEEATSLRSLSLTINVDEQKNLPFYFGALIQIQSLMNLTSLTLKFDGKPGLTDELKLDICHVLSSLHELRYLDLKFEDCLERNKGHSQLLNRPWLEDAFKAIGKRRKLIYLDLHFWNFDFENSSRLFSTLSKSLGKLTMLTAFYFQGSHAQSIGDQSVMTLVDNLKKLTKLECIFLTITKGESYFRSSTFIYLMDCLRNNFPLLSSLTLQFQKFQVTHECYQSIYGAIHQMKSLSNLSMIIGGRQDEGLDMKVLEAEASKRFSGRFFCNPR